MYLTKNGKHFEQTIPTSTIIALVFCTKSTIILSYSNGYNKCKVPKGKLKASIGKNCVFEPSYKKRSKYFTCTAYEGTVSLDDSVASSGTVNIVMTNRSNKHVKFVLSIGFLPLNKSL